MACTHAFLSIYSLSLCTPHRTSPHLAPSAQVPLDMNLLTAVAAVNGPLEFELRVGGRTLRIKATDTAERASWMTALSDYLATHRAEREAAAESHHRRYQEVGLFLVLPCREPDHGSEGPSRSLTCPPCRWGSASETSTRRRTRTRARAFRGGSIGR